MRLLAVVGAAPGIGKSTLCASLSAWLTDAGCTVDHFEEDHVLTRPAFARVAADFTTSGVVSPEVLINATVEYLTDAVAAGIGVVVMDSLIPYVPSLLAFGHDEREIVAIADDLANRIAAVPTMIIFLDGDAAMALGRAAAREGPDWLAWYAAKLVRYGLLASAAPDLVDVSEYLLRERTLTTRVLRRLPWELVVVEDADELPTQAVLDLVREKVIRFCRLRGG
jgi:hypothetical protein